MTAITYDYLNRLEQAGFTQTQADALIVFSSQFVSDMTNKLETNLEKQLSNQIEQFDKVQLQTNHLDSNIKSLEHKMEQRFDLVDQRFKLIDKRFDEIDQRFKWVDQRFDEVGKRFELVDKRFESLTNLIKWSAGTIIALIPAITALINHL